MGTIVSKNEVNSMVETTTLQLELISQKIIVIKSIHFSKKRKDNPRCPYCNSKSKSHGYAHKEIYEVILGYNYIINYPRYQCTNPHCPCKQHRGDKKGCTFGVLPDTYTYYSQYDTDYIELGAKSRKEWLSYYDEAKKSDPKLTKAEIRDKFSESKKGLSLIEDCKRYCVKKAEEIISLLRTHLKLEEAEEIRKVYKSFSERFWDYILEFITVTPSKNPKRIKLFDHFVQIMDKAKNGMKNFKSLVSSSLNLQYARGSIMYGNPNITLDIATLSKERQKYIKEHYKTINYIKNKFNKGLINLRLSHYILAGRFVCRYSTYFAWRGDP